MERHVHLTNLKVNNGNVAQISLEGRMRWKIENEGFNCQKNHGYGLGHKYARKDLNTIKNYYLLMQIGHMISQLVERLNSFKISPESKRKDLQGCCGRSGVGGQRKHFGTDGNL